MYEIEYRVKIPILKFEELIYRFKKKFHFLSHQKRICLMLFFKKNSSILYLRATKNICFNKDTNFEIIHKKGLHNANKKLEFTQDVNYSQFTTFVNLLGSLPSRKKIIMKREILNFLSKEKIKISLIKGKKYAYIEFEKLSEKNKYKKYKTKIKNLIKKLNYQPLSKKESIQMFKNLDKNEDKLIKGKQKELGAFLNQVKNFT